MKNYPVCAIVMSGADETGKKRVELTARPHYWHDTEMKHRSHSTLILALLLASLDCQASNWQWLHNSSLGDLDEADWAAMSRALEDALDTAADGESRHWSNPKSGRQGDFVILKTLENSKIPCRQVRFSPDENAGGDGRPLTFCKEASKGWLVRSQ